MFWLKNSSQFVRLRLAGAGLSPGDIKVTTNTCPDTQPWPSQGEDHRHDYYATGCCCCDDPEATVQCHVTLEWSQQGIGLIIWNRIILRRLVRTAETSDQQEEGPSGPLQESGSGECQGDTDETSRWDSSMKQLDGTSRWDNSMRQHQSCWVFGKMAPSSYTTPHYYPKYVIWTIPIK